MTDSASNAIKMSELINESNDEKQESLNESLDDTTTKLSKVFICIVHMQSFTLQLAIRERLKEPRARDIIRKYRQAI